jgi:hypothetical protein
MALNLRKSIARNGLMAGGVCLVASLALSAFTGGKLDASVASLGWPVLLAAGIGLFTAWQVTSRIKKGVLRALPPAMSYLQLTRGQPVNGIEIDWEAIDTYAIQLETRGYTRLGDFTPVPMQKNFVGVAAIFVDRDASTLVEIQQIHLNKALLPATAGDSGGLHVAIMSCFGGNITASTTDHVFKSSNYVIRGDHSAIATFPGRSLLELLERHTRLRAHLREKTGKVPMPGLTMARYLYLQRERFAQARRRLQAMSGYQIAGEIDAFDAAPRTNWAASSAKLAALPIRSFEELESGEYAQGLPPPVITPEAAAAVADTAGGAATANAYTGNLAPGNSHPLREQINSSANWFYWVAGLSLVNIAVSLAGSKWGFAIGLGLPQLFIALAAKSASNGPLALHTVLLWALSIAVPCFFIACGWLARFPSLAAFVAGAVVFAIDSLLFVVAGDWIGIAFHALVLFFLWKGIAATRQFQKPVPMKSSARDLRSPR